MQNNDNRYIYKITNVSNGKVYIGQTKNKNERKHQHFCELRNNKHANRHLQNSFNKYGEESFVYEIIDHCNVEEIDAKEKYWINHFSSTNDKKGYNIEEGGCQTKNLSQFTRNKISKKAKARFQDPEQRRLASERAKKRFQDPKERERLSIINKGRIRGEDFREKMSQIHTGRKRPQSTKDAISKALSKRAKTPEHCKNISKAKMGQGAGGKNTRSKKVVCLDNNEIFDSLRDAWEHFGVSKSTMRSACQRKGRVGASDGKYYHVMYHEDYLNGIKHTSYQSQDLIKSQK